MGKRKSNWEREDKLLDFIATHRDVILRYLILVMVSELWQWLLSALVFPLSEFLTAYRAGFQFLLWAVPFFLICKLWVLKQTGDDSYTWMMQGMKYIMCVILITLICSVAASLLFAGTENGTLINLLVKMLSEILYFVAMFKIVLTHRKNNF